MPRQDTETHCHCNCAYEGSDHCPYCGCEQYESGDCGETHTWSWDDDVDCNCLAHWYSPKAP